MKHWNVYRAIDKHLFVAADKTLLDEATISGRSVTLESAA